MSQTTPPGCSLDGTFSTAPNMFQQVYVIRSLLGDTATTCAYALLKRKQQATYVELFSKIICVSEDDGFSPDPMAIITKFEQAVPTTPEGATITLPSLPRERFRCWHSPGPTKSQTHRSSTGVALSVDLPSCPLKMSLLA